MAIQSVAVANAPAEAPITMRRVDGIDEYRQCERLQQIVWGPDDIARIPLLDLLTAQENGGIVLGAFAEDRELVGFVYSFPGLTREGLLKQCSVVLCVHPDHRGRGLGRELKLAQRTATLAQGIDLVTWTFDPLLAINAMLNIRRLGGVAREYRVNLYDSGQGLNAGLDTDRLVVEWWLRRRPWPQARADGAMPSGGVAVNEVTRDPVSRLEVNARMILDADDRRVLITVPPDLSAMKCADMALARRWRAETRTLFGTYFARGYVVVDFSWAGSPSGAPAYVLQRGPTT
jgi:predicted GNAT superfamily acetyltransferase